MSEFIVETLHQVHRRDVPALLGRVFANDDPLARSQGIDEAAFRAFIDGQYDVFAADRLSRVALAPGSRRVAAVVLAEVFRAADGEQGSDAIEALIDTARRSYFADFTPVEGGLLHIAFIASDPAFRRRRLVTRLVEHCLRAARSRGIRRAMVEASGIRSRGLLQEHLGFEARVTLGYETFEWGGGNPFAAIAEHGGLTLMDRAL